MFSQHGRTWRAWIRLGMYLHVYSCSRWALFPSFLLFPPLFFLHSFSALVLSFLFFFFLLVWVPSFVIDYWEGKEKRKTRRWLAVARRIEQNKNGKRIGGKR